MLKYILPLIPDHDCYVEPFFGGGAVFFAHEPSKVEVINDLNRDLVGFLQCAKYHLDELLRETDLVPNSREVLETYLAQPGITDIQRAARWFIRHRISFGGTGNTFAVSRTAPLSSRQARIDAIRGVSARLDRTAVENKDYAQILRIYDSPRTFFFIDPPYMDAGGAAYAGWNEFQIHAFASAVQALQGTWMVTYQDCPEIRSAFAGFTTKAIDRANGIGANKSGKGGRYREVIITSHERAAVRKAA